MDNIFNILLTGISTTGVAMCFKIRKKYIPVVALGGILVSGIYFVGYDNNENLFLASMYGAIFAGIWSEIMARVMKAPANIFLIPGIIPLLPGGNLYYTMYWLLQGNKERFRFYRNNTIHITFGVVSGTLVASVIFALIWTICLRIKVYNKRKMK